MGSRAVYVCQAEREVWVFLVGQTGHLHAVFSSGYAPGILVRRLANGRKPDGFQPKLGVGLFGNDQVTDVGDRMSRL